MLYSPFFSSQIDMNHRHFYINSFGLFIVGRLGLWYSLMGDRHLRHVSLSRYRSYGCLSHARNGLSVSFSTLYLTFEEKFINLICFWILKKDGVSSWLPAACLRSHATVLALECQRSAHVPWNPSRLGTHVPRVEHQWRSVITFPSIFKYWLYYFWAEVERQLQGGNCVIGASSSSPRLTTKSASKTTSQSQSHSRPERSSSGGGGSGLLTSRSNTAPVQMRRATNTKGKPIPAPPKRTR